MENNSAFELEFIIKNIELNVEFEDGFFDDDEKKDIIEYIDSLSKEICVDKSYVDCKANKRTSTFLLEEGWNSLKDFMVDTDYCRYVTVQHQPVLVETFATFAKCYMYECLALKTEQFQHVIINVDPNCNFDVIVCKDQSNDWKNYKGKWQTWNYDENDKNVNKDI